MIYYVIYLQNNLLIKAMEKHKVFISEITKLWKKQKRRLRKWIEVLVITWMNL